MCDIPESVFQMSEIPEFVCRKVGISGLGYVGEYLWIISIECTHVGILRFYSLHMGIPRSAHVGPGVPSFDCMGSRIPNSDWITSGIPVSDTMVSGIPSPELQVSWIPDLDLRIPESYQKSGIPVSIPEVVQHCYVAKSKKLKRLRLLDTLDTIVLLHVFLSKIISQ